jgi:nucleoside-diphosphate-sugar epimerase
MRNDFVIDFDDPILITGAAGFIGSRVVEALLQYGFTNLRCFVRPSSNINAMNKFLSNSKRVRVQILKGNLLSREDCSLATQKVSLVFHLAAGVEKSFPGCFLNSVVTTRNLLEAVLSEKRFKRFLNVSSFAVYSGLNLPRGALLDETCRVEERSHLRYEGYTYGKVKQDELVLEYNKRHNIPYVIVRPGVVYGEGKPNILGRIGIDSFGIFLHVGGSGQFPLSYVDNCAEAIVLAGLKKGVDGEVFNIVDDDLPTCRAFLKMLKQNTRTFKSIYVPYRIFYLFCYLWEKYSEWSEGQLPPTFNRMRCEAHWKGHRYTNQRLKDLLGWQPKISYSAAARRYFAYLRGEQE